MVVKLPEKLPGEWALEKVLGPTFDEIGKDVKKLYVKGRDKITRAALNKIEDENDGKQANLRVARDVFWNGSFTNESICAEYFGGVLASSRSEDGKNDDGVYYVNIIKSLSSRQLNLHYVIYNSLNKLLVKKGQNVNIRSGTDLQKESVWFFTIELNRLQLVTTDLHILDNQGLIHNFKYDNHELRTNYFVQYTMIQPSTLGVLLYLTAHNKLARPDEFSTLDFGDFQNISLPKFYTVSLDGLLEVKK